MSEKPTTHLDLHLVPTYSYMINLEIKIKISRRMELKRARFTFLGEEGNVFFFCGLGKKGKV